MSSSDPLLLLRRALTSNHEIRLLSSTNEQVYSLPLATSLQFPNNGPTLDKTTSTRFLLPDSHGNSKTYDLQTLLFGFMHKDASIPEYLQAVSNSPGASLITITDKRVVMDYLSGKTPPEGPPGRVLPLSDSTDGSSSTTDAAPSTSAGGDNLSGVSGEKRFAPLGGDGSRGPPPAKKQRYVPNREDQEKVRRMMGVVEGPAYGHVVGPGEEKREKKGAVYHSRETVLRGERVNNFDSVRSLVAPRLKTLKETQASSSAATPASASTASSKPQKKKQLNPIIIISPSSTALITMHNVKMLLEEGRFIPSDQARQNHLAASSSYVAEDVIQISHARATTSGGTTAETRKARYFVMDNVEALAKFGQGGGVGEEGWDRVVCVMTTGQEWQFKPYKWKDPRELFHHVKGVYPQWNTDGPNPKIKSWNVGELKIDPNKRHLDKSVVADFWRNLEQWIGINKPWLSY
ncbi:hypothetical protein JCM11641_006895 [Rhodosporidiobolus odoratus]